MENPTRRDFMLTGAAAVLTPTELLAQRRERLTPENWLGIIQLTGRLINEHMVKVQNALRNSGRVSYKELSDLENLRIKSKRALEKEVVSGYSYNNTPYSCFPKLGRYIRNYFIKTDLILNSDPYLRQYLRRSPVYGDFLSYYKELRDFFMKKNGRYSTVELYTLDCKR